MDWVWRLDRCTQPRAARLPPPAQTVEIETLKRPLNHMTDVTDPDHESGRARRKLGEGIRPAGPSLVRPKGGMPAATTSQRDSRRQGTGQTHRRKWYQPVRPHGLLAGLGQIDSEVAAQRLIQAARSTSIDVRVRAAHGLAKQKSPMAAAALAELKVAEVYLVRYNAFFAVALLQPPLEGEPAQMRPIRFAHESAVAAAPEVARARKSRGPS